MSEREQKALVIAATSKIKKVGGNWLVPSQSGNGRYKVDFELQHCTCPDHETRQVRCKHIIATEIVIRREQTMEEDGDGQTTITETVTVTQRTTYRQE